MDPPRGGSSPRNGHCIKHRLKYHRTNVLAASESGTTSVLRTTDGTPVSFSSDDLRERDS